MDHCVVCLSTNVDILSRINFYSSEWQEFQIQLIIEKYLWWWYMKQTAAEYLPWICRQCWQELSNFHTFYLKVEKVHKQYDHLQGTVSNGAINDNTDKITLLVVKEEFDLTDCNLQTLKEETGTSDECNAETKNSTVINESMETKEHPATIIKDEHLTSNSDDGLKPNEVKNSVDSDSLGNTWHTSLNYENSPKFQTPTTKRKKPIKSMSHIMTKTQKDASKTSRRKKQIKPLTKNLDYTVKLEVGHKNDEKCDKLIFTKAGYDQHISYVPEEDQTLPCNQSDHNFTDDRLSYQHKVLCHQNKHRKCCDICGKSFRERSSFMRHMAEHNGTPVEKVTCIICGSKLINKYELNRHIKRQHLDKNQEQICPYCSKVSPTMQALRQHVNYSHNMERKHACHMCEKKFKLPRQLKEHISTHTGEPLYTCLYCPQTFKSNANMHKHRKAAHPIEWASVHCRREKTSSKTEEIND